jgi:hypothetical protein
MCDADTCKRIHQPLRHGHQIRRSKFASSKQQCMDAVPRGLPLAGMANGHLYQSIEENVMSSIGNERVDTQTPPPPVDAEQAGDTSEAPPESDRVITPATTTNPMIKNKVR